MMVDQEKASELAKGALQFIRECSREELDLAEAFLALEDKLKDAEKGADLWRAAAEVAQAKLESTLGKERLTVPGRMAEWLLRHERDIAVDLEDFGDLRDLFTDLFERSPNGV